MGELKVKIKDDVERVFREMAMRKFGYQKGSLSEAAEEAFEGWTELEEEGKLTKEDLWDELEGIMKHVKKGSVQLQHEVWDYIANKHTKRMRKKR